MNHWILAGILTAIAVTATAAQPSRQTWVVDGTEREALVAMPEKTENASPLVFVFHGHGGTMRNASRDFRIHEIWPEAAVVYMQGLPTPGQLTDPEGKRNGWNSNPDDSDNRDLKFFDVVLSSLADSVDTDRVYATGHSNGGGFTYCLLVARGDRLAAAAPSGAASRFVRKMAPKPVLHIAGENDPLVKYAWKARTMQQVHRINRCAPQGEPWFSTDSLAGTIYSSENSTPLAVLISNGGHRFPADAPEFIVRFFSTGGSSLKNQ